MRLLLVTDQTFPSDEPFLREVYAKRWREVGDVVYVMQAADDASPSVQSWFGHRVHVLSGDAYGHFQAAKRHLADSAGPLERIYQEDGPFDVVQVRNDLALGLDAARLAARHDLPFVYRLSHLKAETLQLGSRNRLPGYTARDYFRGAVGKRVRQILTTQAEAILTISDAMSAYLVRQGCWGNLEAVPMAANTLINPNEIKSAPFRSRFDLEDVPYLVYIGTMNPIRRLNFLFAVLKQMHNIGHESLELVLVGGRDKTNRERLQSAAVEYGVIDAVTFTGWVSHETVRRAVVGAKVGLSPIPENYVLRTNSPTKILEYLNLATPAVATPTPEQKRALRESGAGELAPRQPIEFADSIRSVINNEKHRCRMGRHGREYIVSERSYDHVLRQVLDVYENI